MKHTRTLLVALLLAPLAAVHAAEAPKIVAPVGGTEVAQAGSSVLNPVDDAKFARLGKIAWRSAFERGDVFHRRDLEAVMNRSEPLGLTSAPTGKAILSDEEFQRRVKAATLALFIISESMLKANEGAKLGTAFLVQEDVVATCFHSFKNLGETFAAVAVTASGKTMDVSKILAVYPSEDLILLQVDGAGKEFLPLRADAPAGLRVRAIGHPLSKFFFTIEGTIGRYAYTVGTASEKHVRMNLMIDSIGGFSGAAVLDASGNAVGMLDSIDSLPAGDNRYQMQSAIPAATILAHFTQSFKGKMSPEAMDAVLKPEKVKGGNTVVDIHNITTQNSKGTAVSEVRSDDPTHFEIHIEDASGKEIARGNPSAALRESLPDWARRLYDVNIKDAQAKVKSVLQSNAAQPSKDP